MPCLLLFLVSRIFDGFQSLFLFCCLSVTFLRCSVGIREACVPVLPCSVCIRMSKCVIQEGEVFLSDIFVLESWGHRTAVGGFCLPLQREVLFWAFKARVVAVVESLRKKVEKEEFVAL